MKRSNWAAWQLLLFCMLLSGCENSVATWSPFEQVAELNDPVAVLATDVPSYYIPEDMAEYNGPLYHVFYHFLIAFPEIAYTTSYGKNMDEVCVSPTEFWRSLEELYKNDFVLVDINRYLTIQEDGSILPKPIMVPDGKKPLIMSFDDINYYSVNHGKGICDKIILDENGAFAMLTLQADGAEWITYDNGVIPLLEKFCQEHPDFSPLGDKGLLALTGYDGILGYRIQQNSPNREAEIEAVKPVVAALKSSGWSFASHSYGHLHTQKATLAKIQEDTLHWAEEIAPVLGETQVYVFPYGEYKDLTSSETQVLFDQGFRILCGVGMPPYAKYYDRFLFMDRQFVDGTSLRHHVKWLAPLMDATVVYCPEERPQS